MRSRDSFLMILDFLNIYKHNYISILMLLQPEGKEFYDSFINKGIQFDHHDEFMGLKNIIQNFEADLR